eukprot:41792-Chlamydomonas_euryale.AAC.1
MHHHASPCITMHHHASRRFCMHRMPQAAGKGFRGTAVCRTASLHQRRAAAAPRPRAADAMRPCTAWAGMCAGGSRGRAPAMPAMCQTRQKLISSASSALQPLNTRVRFPIPTHFACGRTAAHPAPSPGCHHSTLHSLLLCQRGALSN